jgi:hypothetical protein
MVPARMGRIRMKNADWSIEDIIDLEYFLQQDEGDVSEPGPALRDREIYLRKIRPLEKGGEALTPSYMIRLWLQERRKIEKRSDTGQKSPLPGETFSDIHRLLSYGLMIAGVLSGGGLAFSLLNYRGTEPLNVSVYLAALLLSQCVALLLLLTLRMVRGMRRSPFRGSVVFALISRLITRLMVRVKEGSLKGLPGSRRAGIEAATGLIRGRRQVYGTLFYWPVFILCQLFGVGFNMGALAATLLKVIGSDIAFGWQSTIQFSAQAVHKIVQVIALPWSWWVPAHAAHPSLSEIEGSHMVLKDGIYHLATQDLVSWWPFLFLAVLTYGLVPRAVLLAVGLWFQKRSLARVDFTHAACARLVHRLTRPIVATQAPLPPAEESGRGELSPGPEPVVRGQEEAVCGKNVIALIPDDIFDACRDGSLATAVSRRLGCEIREKIRFGSDLEGDDAVLEEMARLRKAGPVEGLLLLQEAWQPPIRETLNFIEALRKAVGNRVMIWVGLIGRPHEGRVFTVPAEDDVRVWQQKLKALGDPYLGVERLATDDT